MSRPRLTACLPDLLLLKLVALGLILWGLSGCATPQQKADRAAWQIVCANAPHRAGATIASQEQRAMTQLHLWHTSVADVDKECIHVASKSGKWWKLCGQ